MSHSSPDGLSLCIYCHAGFSLLFLENATIQVLHDRTSNTHTPRLHHAHLCHHIHPWLQDLPEEKKPCDLGPSVPQRVSIDVPSRDYTPPQYIGLLVTDLGVLTPAAVSDELIQLYA